MPSLAETQAPLTAAPRVTPARGRILVVAQSFPLPSETFVVDHVLGLRRYGWDVHVACLERDESALARLGTDARDIPVHRLASSRAVTSRWSRAARLLCFWGAPREVSMRSASLQRAVLLRGAMSKLLGTLVPDVVHAHFGPIGLIAAAACPRAPLVVDFHGYDVTSLPRAEGWDPYRHLLSSATVVAHSTFVERLLRKHLALDVYRVPLGVDSSRFFPGARQVGSWSSPLQLLSVGRLVFAKGHHVAIETLAMLRRSRETVPAHLTICGGGRDEARLRQHAHFLGVADHVTFRGSVSHGEVASAMQQADVLLVPSLRSADGSEEAFSRVAIEGLASGLLVVGSDVGGLGETIGTGGVVAPPGDAAVLSDAVRDALGTSSRRALAERACRRAADFPITSMHEAYDRLACQARSR